MQTLPHHILGKRAALLEQLSPPFRAKMLDLLTVAADEDLHLIPYMGLRSVHVQARLWRQSRSIQEIVRACRHLRHVGAPAVADVVEAVGPQSGRWATNALPGQSLHQYGLAVDCFVLAEDNSAAWNADHPGYEAYARLAEERGLVSGLSFGDPVHVEAPERPYDLDAWPTIEEALRAEGWL